MRWGNIFALSVLGTAAVATMVIGLLFANGGSGGGC